MISFKRSSLQRETTDHERAGPLPAVLLNAKDNAVFVPSRNAFNNQHVIYLDDRPKKGVLLQLSAYTHQRMGVVV
jgi:hypothetical protein